MHNIRVLVARAGGAAKAVNNTIFANEVPETVDLIRRSTQ